MKQDALDQAQSLLVLLQSSFPARRHEIDQEFSARVTTNLQSIVSTQWLYDCVDSPFIFSHLDLRVDTLPVKMEGEREVGKEERERGRRSRRESRRDAKGTLIKLVYKQLINIYRNYSSKECTSSMSNERSPPTKHVHIHHTDGRTDIPSSSSSAHWRWAGSTACTTASSYSTNFTTFLCPAQM